VTLKEKLYSVVFESDTPAGKLFDVILLVVILASFVTVLLESVTSINAQYQSVFFWSEWIFTALFTIEYVLRVFCSPRPGKYIFSFFGIIDLLSVLPNYLDIFFGGAHYMVVVRVLRLLRIFRILKLSRYLTEAEVLKSAMLASRAKITVFLGAVLTSVIIIGAAMYLIEGPEHGVANIPISIYWAIVTLTTVGYGDIAPATPLGQLVACAVMILGYGIIAVPTGIVTVEFQQATKREADKIVCKECGRTGHTKDALYCKYCGDLMSAPT
jgi:voltage-gated potassium channel